MQDVNERCVLVRIAGLHQWFLQFGVGKCFGSVVRDAAQQQRQSVP